MKFEKREDNSKNKRISLRIYSILWISFLLLSFSSDSTSALFTSSSKATVSVQADTIKPPESLTIRTVNVGETNLSWIASPSAYVTGYNILRSTNAYGPWTTIGSVLNRTATSYVDKNAGATQWIYRVESVYRNWFSTSKGYESPAPVGKTFFDSFLRPGQGAISLDGQKTEDGKSVWQVWSGIINSGAGIAISTSPTGVMSNAVVRTPSHDGQMFAEDFDGAERLIIRGKDPENYIYAGSVNATAYTGANYAAGFEIAEVKNGVVYPLLTGSTGTLDKDVRVEVRGSSIKAYMDAQRGVAGSGTLIMEVTSTYLMNDPAATYFGIGFTRPGFGINDFTFEAY